VNAKPESQWQILNKDISQKIFFKCVIFRSKILQKLWIFILVSIANTVPVICPGFVPS
jgi:hypothetical protein